MNLKIYLQYYMDSFSNPSLENEPYDTWVCKNTSVAKVIQVSELSSLWVPVLQVVSWEGYLLWLGSQAGPLVDCPLS